MAAFANLVWWKALVVSFASFIIIIYSTIFLFRYFIYARLKQIQTHLLDKASKPLRGASVQVNAVRPTVMPRAAEVEIETQVKSVASQYSPSEATAVENETRQRLRDRHWYEIELTVFPPSQQDLEDREWKPELFELRQGEQPQRFFSGPSETVDDVIDQTLFELGLIEDGKPLEVMPPSLVGPQRLVFVAGVRKAVRELQLRYVNLEIGRIPLSNVAQALKG